jgi:sigma-B regulation protein RsbU (phosphoserine phosphatase)
MSAAENSSSIFGQYLELFAHTEIFIFVFMEIVTKLKTIQRVIFKEARLKDYIVFTTLFGFFSIFGTYIGITDSSGAISNIRDLAPMIAGLVAGPVVGLSVGLIGGIHRFFLGGVTAIPCALATILAGLLAGMIYRLHKEKLLGIIPSMLFAVAIEFLHAGLALLLVSPFNEALEIVLATVPQMIIAVSLGMGISVIIIHSTKESVRPLTPETHLSPSAHGAESGIGRAKKWLNSHLTE